MRTESYKDTAIRRLKEEMGIETDVDGNSGLFTKKDTTKLSENTSSTACS
jgi:hypothetical protein